MLTKIFFIDRDKEFEPSKDRRQMDDPNAQGRRPDYFMKLILAGLTCYLIVLEAKKSPQTSPTQTDKEKVANLLKDSIDYLARAFVDVSKIKLFGFVVVGKYNDPCLHLCMLFKHDGFPNAHIIVSFLRYYFSF